jgi:transposase
MVNRRKRRKWQDVAVCGKRVYLQYAAAEIDCPTHGRVQEEIPWAERDSRITYLLDYGIVRLSQEMTQKAACRLLQIKRSTFSDRLHRLIERHRKGHRIRGLKRIGVDEIAYSRGHKYATLVYDLEKNRVVWIGKGKKRESIDRFFNEEFSAYQKQQIQLGCCDMSEAYLGALKAHCPNIRIVLDRFHVVKALNTALDEVRKEQWRQAKGAKRKALKGLRWLLFKRSSNRSRRDSHILRQLRKANRRIWRAWELKDEFERFWDYKAPWAAKRFLASWCTAAMRSRLEPLRKFVGTIRGYAELLLNFIGCRLTNAAAEGNNRLIKLVQNRASGFRHLEAFSDLVFLTVGDVDIPGRIPSRFRVL